MHNDHAGALSQFILYLWFVYHKKVTIYCKCERIQEYLDITGTTKDGYELKTESTELEFIKTEHVKELDAYGFRLNVEGHLIVYTGDTSTLTPFIPYLEKCDEFYVDVSQNGGVHIKFEDVIKELKEIKEKGVKIYLMHLDDKEYIRKLNNNEFYID